MAAASPPPSPGPEPSSVRSTATPGPTRPTRTEWWNASMGVGSEVLGITIYSHARLERLLRGFNAAYNARRQRVLDGRTPDQVVAERLKARRKLANAKPQGRAGPEDIAKARVVAEAAKEVSRPDTRDGPRLRPA